MDHRRSLVVSVPTPFLADQLGSVPGVEALVWDLSGPHERQGDIQVVVPPYMGMSPAADVFAGLPSLELVQLLTAGYEKWVAPVPAGVALANGAGIHDASTAELAVGLAIASQRELPAAVRDQDRGHWRADGRPTRALADSRVMVVGYGSIGRAIARRLHPFEVGITAVASQARDGDEFVDQVHSIDEVLGLLPQQDVVILILPLTDRTRHLVGAEFLAAMPDGALLVNMARGPIVDTDALVAECSSGRLRAALDVTDPEPLPEGHPLWSLPTVLVTPHIGGASEAMMPRAVTCLRAQVERLRDGLEPEHVVLAADRH